MELKAYKMDGLGNDFVIIDRRKDDVNLSKEEIIKQFRKENNLKIIFDLPILKYSKKQSQ